LIIFRQLSEVGMDAFNVDVRQALPDQVRYDYLGLSQVWGASLVADDVLWLKDVLVYQAQVNTEQRQLHG
jgi:hypothetical protein